MEYNYSTHIADKVYGMLGISIAKSQTIVAGDLLVATATSGAFATTTFAKATVPLSTANCYCVATEDVTTDSTAVGTSSGFFGGTFSDNIIAQTSIASDKLILAMQGIYLVPSQI